MRYNDVIKLIGVEYTYDAIGNSKKKKVETTVFANKYQISESEFYSSNISTNASQHMIRSKSAFQIRTIEYNNQQQYLYNKKVYDIIRVSDKGDYTLIVGVETIDKS